MENHRTINLCTSNNDETPNLFPSFLNLGQKERQKRKLEKEVVSATVEKMSALVM